MTRGATRLAAAALSLLPLAAAAQSGPVQTYRVTGPWKDPKVETISREQSRVDGKPASAG